MRCIGRELGKHLRLQNPVLGGQVEVERRFFGSGAHAAAMVYGAAAKPGGTASSSADDFAEADLFWSSIARCFKSSASPDSPPAIEDRQQGS